MDPSDFTAPDFGTAEREPGNRWAFWYFRPTSLPQSLDLSSETIFALSEADAALGYLQGLGQLVTDPELLLGPYLTREAVASSRIEGTEASLSEVLRAEVSQDAKRREDVREVERYLAATRMGLDLIREWPITQRLVKAIHEQLLTGVRGEEKLPGEFRRSPVWLGSTSNTPETARFVPPLDGLIPELFADWERFVNEPSNMPVLVRCALMHYQFETIHPFLDGNGRIGRLLVGLMLIQERRLSTPLLYLSGYFERNRKQYYDRLQAVRENGEVQEWLQFFLGAVRSQANDAVSRASRLIELRERYLSEASTARSRIGGLVPLMFVNPFLTVSRVEAALDVTNQGARNLLRAAEEREWLVRLPSRGRGSRTYWIALELWRVSEDEPGYDVEKE